MLDRRSPREVQAPRAWLSTGEAGELLGVTGKSVLRLIHDGKLPARRTDGGQFRIERSAVEHFAAGQAYDPDAPARTSTSPKEGRKPKR